MEKQSLRKLTPRTAVAAVAVAMAPLLLQAAAEPIAMRMEGQDWAAIWPVLNEVGELVLN